METPLCGLAFKYRTDKCPQIRHSYTPEYYRILKDKKFKKILELGIGSFVTMRHVDKYQVGASLRMWRDFFPEAHVYGADYDPSTMFEDERITTILCNTLNEKEVKDMINRIGTDIDLVVDDGPHVTNKQIRTAKMILPLLKKDVIYIIEDSQNPDLIKDNLPDYNCEVLKLGKHRDDNLVVITK